MVAFVQSGPVRVGFRSIWRTKQFEATVTEAVRAAAVSVAASASRYWHDEEWTEERHPEMTGEERDAGYFRVVVKTGNRTRIVIGSTAPHTINEELGNLTGNRRPGHHPIRRTIDVTAPKISPALRRALKRSSG